MQHWSVYENSIIISVQDQFKREKVLQKLSQVNRRGMKLNFPCSRSTTPRRSCLNEYHQVPKPHPTESEKISSVCPVKQKAKHTVGGLLTIILRKAKISYGHFPKHSYWQVHSQDSSSKIKLLQWQESVLVRVRAADNLGTEPLAPSILSKQSSY